MEHNGHAVDYLVNPDMHELRGKTIGVGECNACDRVMAAVPPELLPLHAGEKALLRKWAADYRAGDRVRRGPKADTHD